MGITNVLDDNKSHLYVDVLKHAGSEEDFISLVKPSRFEAAVWSSPWSGDRNGASAYCCDQLVASSTGASACAGSRAGWPGGPRFAILEVGGLQGNVPPGFQEVSLSVDAGTRAGEVGYP